MRKILLIGLSLVSLVSCDKSKIGNTIENPLYNKNTNISPDEGAAPLTLKEYLINNGYDKNEDGILQDRELAQIERLDAAGKSITNLDILEKLVNLKQANFANNKIVSANVSNPLITEINLSNNKLMLLDISKAKKLVSNINITGNPKLTCVKTDPIQLTTIKNRPQNIKTDVDKEGKAKVQFATTCR